MGWKCTLVALIPITCSAAHTSDTSSESPNSKSDAFIWEYALSLRITLHHKIIEVKLETLKKTQTIKQSYCSYSKPLHRGKLSNL